MAFSRLLSLVLASTGVPDVLAELFEGAREAAPREVLSTGGGGESSKQPFSGGILCSMLKTLLMSSSYRVRSATARLITSLCRDVPFGEDSELAHENAAVGSRRNGSSLFFREILLAAGSTGKPSCSFYWTELRWQPRFTWF